MRHSLLYVILVLVILLAVICGVSLYQSKYALEVSYYQVASDKLTDSEMVDSVMTDSAMPDSVRIVQLTDLHNSLFGEENGRLVKAVREQAPDLILLTGDMLNNYEEKTEIAVALIEQLTEIAPVYFSYGNHEVDYEQKYGTDLTAVFEAAGAVVLDFEYVDLTCQGQELRLGGLYGYCLPDMAEANINETMFLEDFQNTDRMTLLMCHMPVSWIEYGSLDAWNVDCVFAGHAHGGQVRLPLIGGLYAPDQGFFPGREMGLYTSEDGSRTLVLSRGLGSSTLLPRLNNKPEIVVVDFVPDNE